MTPAPRTAEGRNVTAARPHGQAPSERETAAADTLARQVAMLLEPVLAEINRKLDGLSQKVDDVLALLARWDVASIDALLARLEAAPGAAPRGGGPGMKGSDHPCQER
jgi:tripartite-type tricarboxylate transporter receptor subunit TctC